MDEKFAVLKNSKDVSELNGHAFEEYLRQLFRDLGYKTVKTAGSGDFGADIILEKSNTRIAVQAKQYSSPVGFEAIKEVFFAKTYYHADEAWVVTTSTFTPNAVAAAKSTGVKLIPGAGLDGLIDERKRQLRQPDKRKPLKPIRYDETTRQRRSQGCELSLAQVLVNGDKLSEQVQSIRRYTGGSSIVETPEGAEAIGEYCFSVPADSVAKVYNLRLKRIVIHEGVRYIGDHAFEGCSNLEEVRLPSSLVCIGASAFKECSSLQIINFPPSVISIGETAFSGCEKLRSVTLPPSLTTLGPWAFSCSGIAGTLRLPSSLLKVGKHAFRATEVEDVDASQLNMSVIPEGLFANCTSLRHMTFPPNATVISESSFENTGFKSLVLPATVKSIGYRAFYKCSNLINVSLPSGIERVCRSAFFRCPVLEEPQLDDALYGPIVVFDDIEQAPDSEQIQLSNDDHEISSGNRWIVATAAADFTPADFELSPVVSCCAFWHVYRMGANGEEKEEQLSCKNETTVISLRPGDRIAICNSTARRIDGEASYLTEVNKNYFNAIYYYSMHEYDTAQKLIWSVERALGQYDDFYREYQNRCNDFNSSLSFSRDKKEIKLSPLFGSRSGFSMLLLAKVQTLDAALTCLSWETYYSLSISLYPVIRRYVEGWAAPTLKERADYCCFAMRMMHDAFSRAIPLGLSQIESQRSIVRNSIYDGFDLFGPDDLDLQMTEREIGNDQEQYSELMHKLVNSVVDSYVNDGCDISYIRFIKNNAAEFDADSSWVPEYLDKAKEAFFGRYQLELSELEQAKRATLSEELSKLNAEREAVCSSVKGRDLLSIDKLRRRKARLGVIDVRVNNIKRQMDNLEQNCREQLWDEYV